MCEISAAFSEKQNGEYMTTELNSAVARVLVAVTWGVV